MAIRTVNPDGTITGEVDTLDNRLNLTNSSMVMPELKDAIYGAFNTSLSIIISGCDNNSTVVLDATDLALNTEKTALLAYNCQLFGG